MTTKRNKVRPRPSSKPKHKKPRRRWGRETQREAKLAGGVRERGSRNGTFSRMKGDLSHKSTYKRKPPRITMINKF